MDMEKAEAEGADFRQKQLGGRRWKEKKDGYVAVQCERFERRVSRYEHPGDGKRNIGASLGAPRDVCGRAWEEPLV